VVNLHAKFEVSSSNLLEKWMVSQHSISRSRDPFPTPFDLFFFIFSLVPLVINLHDKFEVSSSNRSRDMERVPKFKMYVTWPLLDPLRPIFFYFLSLVPRWSICMPNLKFLS